MQGADFLCGTSRAFQFGGRVGGRHGRDADRLRAQFIVGYLEYQRAVNAPRKSDQHRLHIRHDVPETIEFIRDKCWDHDDYCFSLAFAALPTTTSAYRCGLRYCLATRRTSSLVTRSIHLGYWEKYSNPRPYNSTCARTWASFAVDSSRKGKLPI